jgi:hypothetical protein
VVAHEEIVEVDGGVMREGGRVRARAKEAAICHRGAKPQLALAYALRLPKLPRRR